MSHRLNGFWIILALGILLTACSRPSVSQYDWPCWRGPDGNGISSETGWNPKALEGGPHIVWKAAVGTGYSNVAIQDNRLYTMGFGENNSIYCLNANTGKILWEYSYEGYYPPQATPTVEGTSVYCLNREETLFCLAGC